MAARKRPRVYAVAGWRYEPKFLVDELKANLSWVDELVIVDDRARKDRLWVHEAHYRQLQRQALIDAGIQPWDAVLVTSPDERWQVNAEQVIRPLIARRTQTIYSFPLRELWTKDHFRTDGMWGRKTRPRVFPFLPGQKFTRKKIQTPPTPRGKYRHREVPQVAIYHLENIDPTSRAERAMVYEALSPGSQKRAAGSGMWKKHAPEGAYMRRYGYAYLADPRGAELAPIPKGRGFTPPVKKTYRFRVPDHLLVKECGRTRAQLESWLNESLDLEVI